MNEWNSNGGHNLKVPYSGFFVNIGGEKVHSFGQKALFLKNETI